jgi:hypothetical protein
MVNSQMSNVWKNQIQTPFIAVVAAVGGLAVLFSLIVCFTPALRNAFSNCFRRREDKFGAVTRPKRSQFDIAIPF